MIPPFIFLSKTTSSYLMHSINDLLHLVGNPVGKPCRTPIRIDSGFPTDGPSL